MDLELGVSAGAQWSKSRAAGGERRRTEPWLGEGRRGEERRRKGRGGEERARSVKGVVLGLEAPGLRPRGLLALLWGDRGSGETLKTRGWGQLDRDLRTRPVGKGVAEAEDSGHEARLSGRF